MGYRPPSKSTLPPPVLTFFDPTQSSNFLLLPPTRNGCFMFDDMSFINTTQKTLKPSKKIVLMPRMDEKKLHTREFQLNGSGGNMRCKLLQKRFTGKTTECSKHLRHIPIEKDLLSELNRCIFQVSLKYIKLVIPKKLFILVLRHFNFYSKITWPLQQNYSPAI